MSATTIEQQIIVPARWTVDADESIVEFSVKTFWGLSTVHGRFATFGGYYETGSDGGRIELTIDANSLVTGNRKRDEHLRSDDFFGIAGHPLLRFYSTRVHDVGLVDGMLHVVGELEVAGTTVEVEFPATVRTVDGALEIEVTTAVDQARFGMSRGVLGMIRRPATLHVKARMTH